jgi:hypothetical protein
LIVAALPGRVAALGQDDDPGAGVFDPVLQLQQLDLQQPLGRLVLGAREPLVIRVALTPGVDRGTVRAQQHRVVIVGVVDREAGGSASSAGRSTRRPCTCIACARRTVAERRMNLPAHLPGRPTTRR